MREVEGRVWVRGIVVVWEVVYIRWGRRIFYRGVVGDSVRFRVVKCDEDGVK